MRPRPSPRRCARPRRAAPRIGGAATFSNPYAWPTMRMPSTSTTLPSRSNSGSRSASSGDRTRWTGTPTCAARRTQSSAGNFATASRIASWNSCRTVMPSGAGDTRAGASRGALSAGPGSSSSISAALRMKRGSATQWWVQRPSEPLKNPFGARGSKTHELNPSRSACSTRCQVPTVVASAPCSIDVCTCWPRPVISRARSAALIATRRVVERREADPRDAAEQRSGPRRADHAARRAHRTRGGSPRARAARSSCRRRRGSRTAGRCAPRRARRTRGDARASRSRRTR